jgi:hypothetical protein
MAQVVSRLHLTAEVRFRARISLREIFGGQSDTETSSFSSSLVLPRQHHSTGSPCSYTNWGLTQGPVVAAARPINMNNNNKTGQAQRERKQDI